MNAAATKTRRSGSAPRSGWSGVLKLKPSDHESPVRPLLAMLPGRQSGEEEIVAHLSALRARIPGWLHQDEFGPSRREQTAALRTLKRSIGRLHLQLSTGAPRFRARLDMELRNSSDALSSSLEAVREAAVGVEGELRFTGTPTGLIKWVLRVKDYADASLTQLALLDDNTDGQIAFRASCRNFDLSQTLSPQEFGLTDIESWLTGYSVLLQNVLNELTEKRGAQERVSLKMLVEILCRFWEFETGQPVAVTSTADGVDSQRVDTELRSVCHCGSGGDASRRSMVRGACRCRSHNSG